MSPLAIWNHIPTVLDLNGPSLEFTTQPTGLTTTIGYAVTFSGIATVSFPAGTAIEGNIAYQWYNSTDGTPVTDGNRSNSRGGITTFSGAGTTSLSIINAQFVEDHNDEFYLQADFKPVGYWRPGNESPNPNAINDTLNSDSVTLSVPARLSITLQPEAETDASTAIFHTFNVNATLTDPSLDSLITYRWKLDGNYITDDSSTIGSRSKNLKIKRSAGTYSVSCEVSHADALPSPILSNTVAYITSTPTSTIYSELLQLSPSVTVETTSANLSLGPLNIIGREIERTGRNATKINFLYSKDSDIDLLLEIAAAGGSSYNNNRGGRGGWSLLKLSMKKDIEYSIKMGSNDADFGPWGGLVDGYPVRGTYGGGGAYLYKQNRPIAVMGGGGGAGTNARGGDGGGSNQNGENGGGRQGGAGGNTGPIGRGEDNFSADRLGKPTAACISPATDKWRDEGLSDCANYSGSSLSKFISAATGDTITNTEELYRGFRNGAAGRLNGGWGLNGAGGAGGGGADGGDGAQSNGDGGGGASGWADAGEVDILESRTGVNANDAYMRISLYDPNAPLPSPPASTPEEYTSIEWDNSTLSGYRTGDPSSVGGSDQTVSGTVIYGPQGNVTTGITTSPPTDYSILFTGYRTGVGGNGIYFNPSTYVDSDNNTRAFGLSYIDFKLYIQDLGPVGGDDISYLTSNRGNRDASEGTVRKWYTGDASEASNEPNLYTTNQNEAFVPFRIEFELAFACTAGGDYRVLYMTKTYDWTTFGQTQDVEFNSGDLATQNNITPSGNKLIFPDYWRYNYENPRIVYIRSKIINLDTQEENTINMYARCATTDSITGNGNYLEFGKYLVGGESPTGIAPSVVPVGPSQTVTFTVNRSAADSNTVTYRKVTPNVEGPYEFTFGPDGSTQSYTMGEHARYVVVNKTYSGGRGLNMRLPGSPYPYTAKSVECDDVGDNDYNDLTFSVNKGYFDQSFEYHTYLLN